jgi:hypothetical protein
VAEIHLVESALHRATGDLRAAEWRESAPAPPRPVARRTLARGLLALAAVHDAQAASSAARTLENQARDISIEREQKAAQLRAELTTLWNAGTPPAPVDAA